ncbi:TIGR03943 family putative permease subunit [Caldalkalibacillus salinus]|uniref:TIGR03943 family putative permease subunit n=1 Tax=Caldalkalibacillus salinus TaxID=2803787 RepID=UPI001921B54F|nr:TIGR03943 family protein [Caldalkalibacillus salinus]
MRNDNSQGSHAFLRGIIMFGFTMLILSMVLSGSIRYYIAPQMMPFIYFALGTFFILSIVQIIRSTPKGQEEEAACDCGADHTMRGPRWSKVLIYSIFIFPLLTGFILPDQVLDSRDAATRGVQLGSGLFTSPVTERSVEASTDEASTDEARRDAEENITNESETARADEYLENFDSDATDEDIEHYTVEDLYESYDGYDDYYSELADEWLEQDTIQVKEENFLDAMTVLDLYMYDLTGKQVELIGFVYREQGLEEDEMVVARFSMTCCTADSAVYGLLVKGEETKQFQNDTWVSVVGTLGDTEFNDYAIPMLNIEAVYEVEEPDTPYVYPSFFSY